MTVLVSCYIGRLTVPGGYMEETHDLFEIMATTRSMRRLKPDPVPAALIRKNSGSGRLSAFGRKHAALAVPRRPGREGQTDDRGLLQAGMGRGSRTSVWRGRTGSRNHARAVQADARCGAVSFRPHSGCPGVDRPVPRRGDADPDGGLLDLSGRAEHAAGGPSARSGCHPDDPVPEF